MGVYNRGRPRKVEYGKGSDIPNKPGEYRIRDKKTKEHLYIGETNNLRRRANEHKKTGKFGPGTTLEYMVANTSTSLDRRQHEQRSIKKHSPSLNRSRGGEGRPAKTQFSIETINAVPTVRPKRKRFKWVILLIAAFFVLVLLYLLSGQN